MLSNSLGVGVLTEKNTWQETQRQQNHVLRCLRLKYANINSGVRAGNQRRASGGGWHQRLSRCRIIEKKRDLAHLGGWASVSACLREPGLCVPHTARATEIPLDRDPLHQLRAGARWEQDGNSLRSPSTHCISGTCQGAFINYLT